MELEVVGVWGEVRVCASIDGLAVGVRGESYEYGCRVNKSSTVMLHSTRTEQYINNIRKWKRIESQKVRKRFRVKIRAVVTNNLGLGLEVMGMNRVGVAW